MLQRIIRVLQGLDKETSVHVHQVFKSLVSESLDYNDGKSHTGFPDDSVTALLDSRRGICFPCVPYIISIDRTLEVLWRRKSTNALVQVQNRGVWETLGSQCPWNTG